MNAFNLRFKSHAGAILWAAASVLASAPSKAQVVQANSPAAASSAPANKPSPEEAWAIHGQITNVTQGHPSFRSPYSGPNSLQSDGRVEETTDITAFAGLRLWHGGEVWLNAEVDQGFGLDNTVGVAGYPSGEAYKIGSNTPYLRLPRGFVRQTIELGGARDTVASSANQLAGSKASDNVTITLGKFSVTDIFDTNTYAHDPRADVLNWSLIDAGAFDYAADAWGFTYGAAAEWSESAWTARGGLFQLSKAPNGKITRVDFHQFMLVAELEKRYEWQGAAGKVKLLGFVNRGRMANYRDATQQGLQQGQAPDVASVRRYASRPGVGLNIEHALTPDLGVFMRASMNDGTKEAYEFTEINKSLSAGLSWKGTSWNRAHDTLMLAGAVNGLSGDAQAYFSAGGTGILIGDSRLTYGAESIVETSYSAQMSQRVTFTLDYQHITHPAYNRDRGPVSIYSLRAHAEF